MRSAPLVRVAALAAGTSLACAAHHAGGEDDEFVPVVCYEEREVSTWVDTSQGWSIRLTAIATPTQMIEMFHGPPDVTTPMGKGQVAYTYLQDREKHTEVTALWGTQYSGSTSAWSSGTLTRQPSGSVAESLQTTVSTAGTLLGAARGSVTTTESVGCKSTLFFDARGRQVGEAVSEGELCVAPELVTRTRSVETEALDCGLQPTRRGACGSAQQIRVVGRWGERGSCYLREPAGERSEDTLLVGSVFTRRTVGCSTSQEYERAQTGWYYVVDAERGVRGFADPECFRLVE